MSYLDTDSINSILSGQEIQRLNVESEKTSGKGIGFMRSIVIHMLLRNSFDKLGVECAYLFYKEIRGYKVPERILRPTNLIISKELLNTIYGRRDNVDS